MFIFEFVLTLYIFMIYLLTMNPNNGKLFCKCNIFRDLSRVLFYNNSFNRNKIPINLEFLVLDICKKRNLTRNM